MKNKKSTSPEEIQRVNLLSYLDMISPSTINFKLHPGYYVLGNTYRSVWAVKGFQKSIKATPEGTAILRKIGECDGVTLHIYTRPVTDAEKSKILASAEKREVFKASTAKSGSEAVEGHENISDIVKMAKQSHKMNEGFFYSAIFIEIIGNTGEDLRSKQSQISYILNENKILTDKLYAQQAMGFFSVSLAGKNMFSRQFERVYPASSVANLFPFSYSGKTDPRGLFLGRDVNGANILADFDRRTLDKTNGHILILGNSGEGKSYLMKTLIESFRMAGKKIYILDPDNEYQDLTVNLDGTYLDMMSSEYFINVLEPRLWSSSNSEGDDDSPEPFKHTGRLSQHIAYLRDFFKCYKDLEDYKLDIIEIMLKETYRRHRISDSTNFSALDTDGYPILSDLYTVIEQMLGSYDEDIKDNTRPIMYTKEQLQQTGLSLQSICVGSDSKYFNGTTNIPNADFIDFCVKDALTTNESLKNAMFLNIFSYMSHKFLTVGDCNLFVDELHEFLKNKIAINYIRSFTKRGRKKNSGVCIASQNVEDFFLDGILEYTRPLLSIPSHSFLFHPGINCDPKDFQKNLNVQPHEFNIIAQPKQGFCLYKSGTERFHLHVIAPPHRKALFGTAGGVGAA